MITYADIQRIYRNEKASVELQKVEDSFYKDSMDLLAKIDEVNKSFVERMVNEIFERRRNKIVLASLRTTEKEPVNMIAVERTFFYANAKTLNEYKANALSDGKHADEKAVEETKLLVKKIKVKFFQPLPAIIGTDMVHYGPFNENDVAELPEENASILIVQNVAEEVD